MVRLQSLNLRERLREAEDEARKASDAEREASLIADVACVLLADREPVIGPATIARVSAAVAKAGLRMELKHAPGPAQGEMAIPLRLRIGSGWLYTARTGDWAKADAERVAGRLTELLDHAQMRADSAGSVVETEAARHAQIAKSSMLHAISHDLRAPLTALRAKGAAGAELDQLERMVDDLANLSRIGAGAVSPQPERVDLNEAVRSAADEVSARRDGHEVRLDLPENLPPVQADKAQIQCVFANLIDNAMKFSPPGTPVVVRGAAADTRVTIRVLDSGPGVPARRQADVFEPFVRGGDGEPGPGLGLAICRGFVEANGGRITVQSGARDGSAFAVSFPVEKQRSVAR